MINFSIARAPNIKRNSPKVKKVVEMYQQFLNKLSLF
jgi:hypothetical protein